MRGHINIKAIERLNNEWIAGMNIIRASDATYLSRYVLEKKQSLIIADPLRFYTRCCRSKWILMKTWENKSTG